MNCTNCNLPSAGEYCDDCEQFRERLEKLRAAQKQFWRLAAEQKAARLQNRPISGQDAALPPGDRG